MLKTYLKAAIFHQWGWGMGWGALDLKLLKR
jgi:hypothetical protein